MSYHVNASCSDGAVSEPALTLEQAQTISDEFKAKGYMSVVIVDAGTGMPVRGHPVSIKVSSATVETPPSAPVGDNASSQEADDLIVALQATADDPQPLEASQKPATTQE